jgi:hypothetical protein
MAAALLAVVPVVALPLPGLLIFLHSPGYMAHQVEEHTGDRFRRFANARVFAGNDVLTTASVLFINLPFVWGVNLLALYAAILWGPAWGLVAPYVMLVNAITHVIAWLGLRTYNPGLVTGIFVFLPLSLATIRAIGLSGGLTPHFVGAGLSILLHLAIIGVMATRYRALRSLVPG